MKFARTIDQMKDFADQRVSGLSYAQIGRNFGVTGGRARQVIARYQRLLRSPRATLMNERHQFQKRIGSSNHLCALCWRGSADSVHVETSNEPT